MKKIRVLSATIVFTDEDPKHDTAFLGDCLVDSLNRIPGCSVIDQTALSFWLDQGSLDHYCK